jgi:hypothetical protein
VEFFANDRFAPQKAAVCTIVILKQGCVPNLGRPGHIRHLRPRYYAGLLFSIGKIGGEKETLIREFRKPKKPNEMGDINRPVLRACIAAQTAKRDRATASTRSSKNSPTCKKI